MSAPGPLERAEVAPFVWGSLAWAAIDWRAEPDLLERARACYASLIGRALPGGALSIDHLPFGVVLDLYALCQRGDDAPIAELAPLVGAARAARGAYRDAVLNALLEHPRFRRARRRLPAEGDPARAGAVCRLCALVLRPVAERYPAVVLLDPAHLRALGAPAPLALEAEQSAEAFERAIGRPGFFLDGLSALVERGLDWGAAIGPEDLFEIEHWAALSSESTRIGMRQLGRAEAALGVRRVPAIRPRPESASTRAMYAEDTTYPAGGLAGLSTRGSTENLVPSELAYLGEGPPGGPSLFDLRYATRELLYYTRDEGVMRRRRRRLDLIFDLAPPFFAKSPHYDYSFGVLTQALTSRLLRDLMRVFAHDALTARLIYKVGALSERDAASAAAEAALMRLRWRAAIERGAVSIALDAEPDPPEAWAARTARAWALAVTFTPSSTELWRALWTDYAARTPPTRGLILAAAQTADEADGLWSLPLSGLDQAALSALKNEIFATIASG